MRTLPPTLFFSVLLAPFAAGANFHFWDITEVYSNDDGSVQFIELATTFNNQDELINHTLVSGLATFTFPTDLDPDEMGNGNGATAGRHMLVATPAFASQPGAVTPDFVLDGPDFFDFVEDSIDFAGVNTFALGLDELPINGVDSLHEPFGSNVRTLNINSPTNFAGEAGSLGGPTPTPTSTPTPTPTPAVEMTSGFVDTGGGTVSTGTTATSSDPVETSVTVPSGTAGGEVVISEGPITEAPPSGFSFLGQQVDITAPAGTVANPLVLTFSLFAPGMDPNDVEIFKAGVLVGPCGAVPPDPCVESRVSQGADNILIVVRTSTASPWNLPEPGLLLQLMSGLLGLVVLDKRRRHAKRNA